MFNVKKDSNPITNVLFNDVYINDMKLTKLINSIIKYDNDYLAQTLRYKESILSTKHLSLTLKRAKNTKTHENNMNAYFDLFK